MLASQLSREVLTVHEIVARLPRHDWRFDERDLPSNGVYVMFESGEEVRTPDGKVPRIVRVASHRKAGRLADRVRANYGSPYSGSPCRQLALRSHYHQALLRSLGPEPHGQDQGIDERVTREIRERFTFAVVPVDDCDERLELERSLIALLAQCPPCEPSGDWMGRWADERIARSGLWNAKHLGARPLNDGQLARFAALAGGSQQVIGVPLSDPSVTPRSHVRSAGAGIASDETMGAAESLFLGGLTWLHATYQDHDFVARRDVVWTLHKRLAGVSRRMRCGLGVYTAVRNPWECSRAIDLAIHDAKSDRLLLVATVLYEPDHARAKADLRFAALPYTSWDEVRHARASASRLTGSGRVQTAFTVLIDEGGRFSSQRAVDAVREEWCVPGYPSLSVTYSAERCGSDRVTPGRLAR